MNKNMKKSIIIASVAILLVVAVIIVILAIPSKQEEGTTYSGSIDTGIDMTAGIAEDGMHTVAINTNDKGEIENNSYGTLINYVPAQINKITMETREGNYTFLLETPVDENGKTQATIYTLEGFEEYDIAVTNPGLLAGAVCKMDFLMVADLTGANEAAFGFDDPRAKATVYYADGTYSVITLGDDAPGSEQSYVQFGNSKTIYIVNAEEVAPMLYSITDLFNTALNSDKTTVADDSFDKIVLGGTHLDEEVVIVPNTEGSINCYYFMESHNNAPANTTETSAIIGAIKSLTADSVECVNPTDEQLEKYGLRTPYATVRTNYLSQGGFDEQGNMITEKEVLLSVSLLASKADAEGMVYMMEENGNLVYRISAETIPWATTTMEKLASEYVLCPNYMAVGAMTIEAGGETYEFILSTEEIPYVDESGNESVYYGPEVYLNGKYVDPDQFSIFFQDLVYMEIAGQDDGTTTTSQVMKITYDYITDRPSDTVILYMTDTQKVIPQVNSQKCGYIYRNYATALAENLESLAQGKEISTVND